MLTRALMDAIRGETVHIASVSEQGAERVIAEIRDIAKLLGVDYPEGKIVGVAATSKRALTEEALEAFTNRVSEDLMADPLARVTKRRVGGAEDGDAPAPEARAKVLPPRGGDG